MDISDFLTRFVNKSENTSELISLYLHRGQYNFGALFYKKKNTVYELIDHLFIEEKTSLENNQNNSQNNRHILTQATQKHISFTPYKHINNIFISNEVTKENSGGYKSNYPIKNIIIIPINSCNDVIGVICLGNKKENIEEEDVSTLTDLLSLTQLIVNKCKLIEDYKKIYADSTYFSKDLFLANMSHEIRTPLNGIIGYNQLLMNTELTNTQKNYLSVVSQCSIQLMQIINDIIDFSKLSSGNMKITSECFSVADVIHGIHETMKARIQTKNHTFSYKIEKNVPETIILDKQKLTQIIINLLSNAINYTPNGGKIEIIVSNHNYVLSISVIDNGIGISEQNKCKLFNSFIQIHNSCMTGGTGLGLAISKRLVELLKGEINVKSSAGEGSNFYFTCTHTPIEDFEKNLKKDLKLLKNKCILIADDNPDTRIMISDILFEWNVQPIVCASGKEVLRLIANDRYEFDLFLIDLTLGDMSGVDLASKIKNKNPLYPVVALTSTKDIMNMSIFDGKVDKPVNKLNLFNTIHKIIKQNMNESGFIYEGDSEIEENEENEDEENDDFLETKSYEPKMCEKTYRNKLRENNIRENKSLEPRMNTSKSDTESEILVETNKSLKKKSFIKTLFKTRNVRTRVPRIQPRISPKNTMIFNKDIRILIAEDVIYNQNLLDNMLRTLGYNNIFVASDGQETIEKLDEAYENDNPFELLLLDIRMPKMDGYDVIEHVNFKKYPLPKIIAVTASVLQEDRDKCRNLGVEYFITKPINLNKLKNVILRASQCFI
jgi:CheY-like chemotaxis protein